MDNNDIFEELFVNDEKELDIFLDTLKEVFEEEQKRGNEHHER